MDKINNLGSTNINNIGARTKLEIFEEQRAYYYEYIKKVEKSEFANSPTRYNIELNLLENLLMIAQEKNLADETELIKTRISAVKDVLKELGFGLK